MHDHDRAAVAGRGTSSGTGIAGRPVQVLNKPCSARFTYYLVMMPDATLRSEVQAFIDWIKKKLRYQMVDILTALKTYPSDIYVVAALIRGVLQKNEVLRYI